MDVLDDILDTLDLKGALYFRTDFTGPWAVTVPDLGQAARFHLVVQGGLCVEIGGTAGLELGPGDLVLIPKGRSHVLADRAGRPPAPLESVLQDAGYDGQGVLTVGEGDHGASTQLVCGHLNFRSFADHPILRTLPSHLVVTASMRAREPWLDEMLRLLVRRIFADQMGSTASVTRLSEIIFIELLRIGIAADDRLDSVLNAFRDKQIGRALDLIHRQPAHGWTLQDLAAAVGMSRSRFAERFRELVGMGAMTYLGDWRLQRSLALLGATQGSVQQIAGQVGYQSPAAFTRAFTGKFGIAPSDYRHKAV